MSKKLLYAVTIPLLFAGAPVAQAVPEMRSEVPIQQTTLSNGTIRYWLVQIGNSTVRALLDTGTTGLRVLADVIASTDATEGQADSISFGSGTELVGDVSKGRVTVGGLSELLPFQSIKEVKCGPGESRCVPSHAPFRKYGIGGDGIPGEGFPALFGIKMGSAEVANPLVTLGAQRWIVELPRPGAATPGKLVLNPGDAEVADYGFIRLLFYTMHINALHDAVRGCFQKLGGDEKACGAMTFDTGYPAVDIINGPDWLKRGIWDTKAELTVLSDNVLSDKEARAAASFQTGIRAKATEIFLTRHPYHGTLIFAGVVPYLAIDVLYDPKRNEIGLKPREIVAGMPAGRLIPSN